MRCTVCAWSARGERREWVPVPGRAYQSTYQQLPVCIISIVQYQLYLSFFHVDVDANSQSRKQASNRKRQVRTTYTTESDMRYCGVQLVQSCILQTCSRWIPLDISTRDSDLGRKNLTWFGSPDHPRARGVRSGS